MEDNEEPTFIVRNAVRCRACNQTAESTHRHHMAYCPCRAIAADGGDEYLRRVGAIHAYDDASVYGWSAARAEIKRLIAQVGVDEVLATRPDLLLTSAQEKQRYAADEEGRAERTRVLNERLYKDIGAAAADKLATLIANAKRVASLPQPQLQHGVALIVSHDYDGGLSLTVPAEQVSFPNGGAVPHAGALKLWLSATQLKAAGLVRSQNDPDA